MHNIVRALKFQDILELSFLYLFIKKRSQHTILTVLLSLTINSF